MSTMSNRLIEAVKCCQIVDREFRDGVAPNDPDRDLIIVIASYVKAWEQGESRKQAWANEVEAYGIGLEAE